MLAVSWIGGSPLCIKHILLPGACGTSGSVIDVRLGGSVRVTKIEDLHCNAGWRDFSIPAEDRHG